LDIIHAVESLREGRLQTGHREDTVFLAFVLRREPKRNTERSSSLWGVTNLCWARTDRRRRDARDET
jgi:hypothetical protein